MASEEFIDCIEHPSVTIAAVKIQRRLRRMLVRKCLHNVSDTSYSQQFQVRSTLFRPCTDASTESSKAPQFNPSMFRDQATVDFASEI